MSSTPTAKTATVVTAPEEKQYVNPWYRKEENRKIYSERARARYLEQRDERMAKRRVKIGCDLCGGQYTPDHRQNHFRTLKHQNAMKTTKDKVSLLLELLRRSSC